MLGMHRTGTSLVSDLLHNAMGVPMGQRFLGKGPWNRRGTWEDVDFVRMNQNLLKASGGVKPFWRNVPKQSDIDFRTKIIPSVVALRSLVARKAKARWGWKDPRTCLTIGLYAPHLLNPVYVVTRRNEADTITSLERRGSKRGEAYWRKLIHRYESTRDAFLAGTDRPVVEVQFERLTNKKQWRAELAKIEEAARVEVNVGKARGIIEWR